MCHSDSEEQFFAQLGRVLETAGLLMVTDGYRSREPVNETERIGRILFERGMAVDALESYPAVVAHARTQEFTVLQEEDSVNWSCLPYDG